MSKTPICFLCAALILPAFLAISCGGGPEPGGDRQSPGENAERPDGSGEGEGAAGDEGVPVKVALIRTGAISTSIKANSTIEAEESVEIYPRVTGVVEEVRVEEGQTVDVDDVLCTLDDEELSTLEEKARSEMEKKAEDLDRVRTLIEEDIATETELNDAQYQYDQARLEWQRQKIQLDYTQIRATISGIVYERVVNRGDKVDPSVRLYAIYNPASLIVRVNIPESDYYTQVRGRSGAVRAEITSDSLAGRVFDGSIMRISPVVNPQTNTIMITLTYRDPEKVLRPGMFVQVRLVTDSHENAVLVPKDAILYEESRMYVFVVREDQAERIALEEGFSDDAHIESLSQIREGDLVVVRGQKNLRPGTQVLISNPEEVGLQPQTAEEPEGNQ